MNILEKAGLTASTHHIERISKSGIPIYNTKFRTRLAEKQEEEGEEEHRQLQCAMRFCETILDWNFLKLFFITVMSLNQDLIVLSL